MKIIKEGRNLTEESRGFDATLYRDEMISKIVQSIARRRSILLVGENGVGKTKVVHELTTQLRRSGRARVHEISVSQLLSGTKYLGEWESKVSYIIERAESNNTILYFSDIWNLPTAAKSSNRDGTAWDLIRPYLEQGKVQLIGEITVTQLTALLNVKGFDSLFEQVEVSPLSEQQLLGVLQTETNKLKLPLDQDCLVRAQQLSQQFLGANQGPGPAKELLAQIKDYHAQKRDNNEPEDLTPQFIERVFSIYSGLPLIVVSPKETKPIKEIKSWFEDRIIGQKDAITAVVETIALYKAGLNDPNRPIGSFLFVGPTGVGKTELARTLAKFLFGTETRMLRFDLSEYKDYHSFQLLIGNPDRPLEASRLVDPVKAKPFQVILLDEIEKAHSNVWDLLLQLLDEGTLTPPSGKPVNFRNTIVIATSNVGAKESGKPGMGFVVDAGENNERMMKTLETVFRPELLNRFQHLVAFHALSREDVRQIARMELARILDRQGLKTRQISVDVADSVLDLIVDQGHDDKYGARALRRMVQRFVSMPIATLLLEKPVDDGCILRLTAQDKTVKVDVIDTPEVVASRAAAQPIRTVLGTVPNRNAIEKLIREQRKQLDELVSQVQAAYPGGLEDKDLDDSHIFQKFDATEMAQHFKRREILQSVTRRMESLDFEQHELEEWFKAAVSREELRQLAAAIHTQALSIESAGRELLTMPKDSYADAIVELVPLTGDLTNAKFLFELYKRWADYRAYSVEMLCEPLNNDEPIAFTVSGGYSFGYLHMESGHHRFRNENRNQVVRVRVARLTDSSRQIAFNSQRALKKNGLLGGRVRSRLQPVGSDLLIQNSKTLADNKLMADSVVASFESLESSGDTLVRRYDQSPYLIKDFLTGTLSSKADITSGDGFHKLLCQRVSEYYTES